MVDGVARDAKVAFYDIGRSHEKDGEFVPFRLVIKLPIV